MLNSIQTKRQAIRAWPRHPLATRQQTNHIRQIDCLHRILNAFSNAVGRRAENEWKEREAA